ncbi:MAG: BamA/OMP85 family outer membrane protein [Armatimonadota bacterium]
MKVWRLVLALVFAVFSIYTPVAAQESPEAQPPKVAKVVVRGNQKTPEDVIIGRLQYTKPGMDFSENGLLADLRGIRGLGFFYEDSVSASTETTPEGIVVTIDVREHPVITRINITGNKVVPEADIRKVIISKEGTVMNTVDLEKDLKAIQNLYVERGYLALAGGPDLEALISPDGVLTIPITEVMVEDVRVVGNQKTRTSVILREIRTKPGQPLDYKLLQRDVERLFNMDLFEDVQPPEIQAGSDAAKAVVIFNVKEKKTGQISLGMGFSSPQGLVGRVEYSESNFRGRAQAINALAELGGRANTTSYEFGYYEPYLDKKHTSMSVSVFNKVIYRFANTVVTSPGIVVDSNLFNEVRKGGMITFARPLSDYNTAMVSLRSEKWNLHLPEGETVPSDLIFARQNGTVSTATFRGIRDTRDIRTDPAKGSYNSLALELGRASIVGGNSGSIRKITGDFRRYFGGAPRKTVTERKRVLAVRAMFGFASGVVPFVEQFFIGGADTLRGYLESRFWGRRMFLFSAEYRIPLGQSLQGAAFVDIGDAWGSQYQLIESDPQGRFRQHSGFSPRAGFGAGIRVVTPIGPLRLDYGIGSEGPRVHFSIGHTF